ncbi:MAG: dienelactone hydrolase family protein [Massilia sp.]|nr:dienelactone hydrolase family protein [Massilia sp.]
MSPSAHRQLVSIAVDGVVVEGTLALPVSPSGMVLFAHGSGSSRHSPRNNAVAAELRKAGLGTLLMDLLSESEDPDTGRRFDIAMLARRLGAATDWLADYPATRSVPIGLFGASTGAAAALALAAQRPEAVAAVVSRGGRPELAGREILAAVRAPTLLIVGSLDTEVVHLNTVAHAHMTCEKRIDIVEGATHLFEEPGRLDVAAQLAAQWCTGWLVR